MRNWLFHLQSYESNHGNFLSMYFGFLQVNHGAHSCRISQTKHEKTLCTTQIWNNSLQPAWRGRRCKWCCYRLSWCFCWWTCEWICPDMIKHITNNVPWSSSATHFSRESNLTPSTFTSPVAIEPWEEGFFSRFQNQVSKPHVPGLTQTPREHLQASDEASWRDAWQNWNRERLCYEYTM